MVPAITLNRLATLCRPSASATHTLLASGSYRVRALTRNVDSPQAKSLQQEGAELWPVALELGRRKELLAAFAGSRGVFLMTPPIAPPAAHEAELGKELADAAVAAGVQHIIWSGLENVDVITGGKMWAPHFTDKARVEEHVRNLPVASSFIYLAFFYTNLIEYYAPRLDGDVLLFPIYLPADFRAPFVDPLTATGPAVLEIFDNRTRYAGESMPVVGDIISPNEMVETFTRITGKKAAYRSAFTREGMQKYFPAFGANELLVRETLGMVEYAVEYGYYRKGRDLQWSRKIDPASVTWDRFLRNTGWQGETRSFRG